MDGLESQDHTAEVKMLASSLAPEDLLALDATSMDPAEGVTEFDTEPEVEPSFGSRFASLLVVVVPFIGLIAAIVHLWGSGIGWLELGLLVGGYMVTAIGITIGYHRYFTHKSFKTNATMKVILGALGSMCVEGPIIRWVATHRMHHQHTDREHDPHSPNARGRGFMGVIRGAIHSHIGWVFSPAIPEATLSKYVPDLMKDRVVRRVSALFPLWVALGQLIPAAIGYAVTGTLWGAIMGFVWGGLLRVFLVHHLTWSINSVCHIWGSQPFETHDRSRDNAVMGILALGEGWHNTHHAFPASARQGLTWWKPDISYYLIWMMGKVGLVSDIRVPDAARVAAKVKR